MPVVSVPVVIRVRVVGGTCGPGAQAEAPPKPERKDHTFARIPPGSGTQANYEDELRCNADAMPSQGIGVANGFKHFAVQKLVPQLGVKTFCVPIFPG